MLLRRNIKGKAIETDSTEEFFKVDIINANKEEKMRIISISKFSSITKHYYCKVYNSVFNVNVDYELIKSGYFNFDIGEKPKNFEEDLNLIFTKKNTEKEILDEVVKVIREFYGEYIPGYTYVFHEGKYSDARTDYIREKRLF